MRRDLGQMLMFGTACSTHLPPVEEEEKKEKEEEEEEEEEKEKTRCRSVPDGSDKKACNRDISHFLTNALDDRESGEMNPP